MDQEALLLLTLDTSSFVAGPTEKNGEWEDSLRWMARTMDRHSARRSYELSIWFDYLIPGWIKVDGMDFEGDRRGSFLRSIPRFVVAMKLPEQPPSDARLYLARRTRAALSVVEAWRQAGRYSASIATAREVLDAVVHDAESDQP